MAQQRSTNPVFERIPVAPSPEELDLLVHGTRDRLTATDVIVHTAGLFGVLMVGALVGWMVTGDHGSMGVASAAGIVAFGISMVICFALKRVPPVLAVVFAVTEGVFVGGISRVYETYRNGIVMQAIIGTVVVFGVMLALHTSGRLRSTPRMQRIVFASMLGVVGVSLVDLLVRAFSGRHLPPLNDATPLGILVSVGIIVLAAFMLTVDFGLIDDAVRAGAPREAAWTLAYGLMVSVVWVYIEMLRLLSKLRN
jgi:uncharacterized YccA/Bax inhibitor family protein